MVFKDSTFDLNQKTTTRLVSSGLFGYTKPNGKMFSDSVRGGSETEGAD